MHECGDSLLKNLNPTVARPGIFVEKHSCPLCHGVFQITFEGFGNDDEFICHVVRVAANAEPKYTSSARVG